GRARRGTSPPAGTGASGSTRTGPPPGRRPAGRSRPRTCSRRPPAEQVEGPRPQQGERLAQLDERLQFVPLSRGEPAIVIPAHEGLEPGVGLRGEPQLG